MIRTILLIAACSLFFSCFISNNKSNDTIRIASIMYKPVKWEKETNKIALEKRIFEAKKGAKIIVTTEGALEGYVVMVLYSSSIQLMVWLEIGIVIFSLQGSGKMKSQ